MALRVLGLLHHCVSKAVLLIYNADFFKMRTVADNICC